MVFVLWPFFVRHVGAIQGHFDNLLRVHKQNSSKHLWHAYNVSCENEISTEHLA